MAALAALRGGVRRSLLRGLLQVSGVNSGGEPAAGLQGSALRQGPGRATGVGCSRATALTTRAPGPCVSPGPPVLLSHLPGPGQARSQAAESPASLQAQEFRRRSLKS